VKVETERFAFLRDTQQTMAFPPQVHHAQSTANW